MSPTSPCSPGSACPTRRWSATATSSTPSWRPSPSSTRSTRRTSPRRRRWAGSSTWGATTCRGRRSAPSGPWPPRPTATTGISASAPSRSESAVSESWVGRTITEMAAALRDGRVTAVHLLHAAQAQRDRVDGRINAFLARTDELAEQQARAADERIAREGANAPVLCGIPVALKDVLCLDGVATTASSQIIGGFLPPYTGTAVQRLLDQGAVVVGKTNCDEFAMGSSNENSAYGPVGNPWDVERVPGGSSGGSAAAVAAGVVPYALGSDTGGSIRQPASLTGTVRFKPTYGRVSRYGLIAFASSLDQIGPMTRDVGHGALLLQAIAGHDPRESTRSPPPGPD